MSTTSKSQRKNIVVALFILIILSFLIFVYRNSRPVQYIGGYIQSVFALPKSALYSLGKKRNDSKIAQLIKQNKILEQKMSDYELIKKDNEALKSQFVASGETSQNLVAANIIGFSGDNKYPIQLIVNVGKKANIKNGMAVVYQKYLIGKITIISENYSVVTTVLNQKFQVLAKLPESNSNGILFGKNDFMLFDGVAITDNLIKGGIVVTKGEIDSQGIGIPPDLSIGKITSISKNDAAPFQSAQISPLIDYSKLIEVFVISQM